MVQVSTKNTPRKALLYETAARISNIGYHLRSLNKFDSGLKSEGKLILARAGKS